MRVLPIVGLAGLFLIGAPVLGGLASVSGKTSAPQMNETVIVKTAPDGTWPFKLKASRKPAVSYWI